MRFGVMPGRIRARFFIGLAQDSIKPMARRQDI
jgi:hypothetical protein